MCVMHYLKTLSNSMAYVFISVYIMDYSYGYCGILTALWSIMLYALNISKYEWTILCKQHQMEVWKSVGVWENVWWTRGGAIWPFVHWCRLAGYEQNIYPGSAIENGVSTINVYITSAKDLESIFEVFCTSALPYFIWTVM